MTLAITDAKSAGGNHARAVASVRARLSALEANGVHVLHSISVGSAACEIDHLLIGPAGVYAITAQRLPGRHIAVSGYTMAIDDSHVPHLLNAKFEAERAASLLGAQVGFDVPVRGCVVALTGAFAPHVTYEARPIGVSLLAKRDIPRWFLRQPAILTNDQVEALVDAARRSTTWAAQA